MAAVHRRRIGLYSAAGDLVRHGAAVAEAVDRAGHGPLAGWVQRAVLAVVSRLVEEHDPEAQLDRAAEALEACGRRLGPHPRVFRALAAVEHIRRWWAFDPVRDGHPPTVNTRPVTTCPPDRPEPG